MTDATEHEAQNSSVHSQHSMEHPLTAYEVVKHLNADALQSRSPPRESTKTAATKYVKTPAKTSIHHPARHDQNPEREGNQQEGNPDLQLRDGAMEAHRHEGNFMRHPPRG